MFNDDPSSSFTSSHHKQEQNQLAHIPDEILIDHLLPFVSQQSLISLKTTNQYFNKLIWDYWIKYKTTYMIPHGIRCGKFENVAKHFVSKLINLTEISASSSLDNDEKYGQELDDFSLFKMLQSLSSVKIKKLDLLECDTLCGNFLQDCVEKKIPLLYSVEEMLLKDLDFELSGLTMQPFENLKRLTLEGKNMIMIEINDFKLPSSLEKLELNYCLNDDFMSDIPNQCPNLTELCVKEVSDNVAKKLMISLPKLTSFHMIQDQDGSSNTTTDILSVFKKRGIALNLTSLSLPFNLDEEGIVPNPFGIYAEKLTDLTLNLYHGEEEEQDGLLNSLVCLKNLKKLNLLFEMEKISFSNKVLNSLSTNSTLKNLESFSCNLTIGASSIIPILVDHSIKEMSLKGTEENLDLSFLLKCPNIETLMLDVIVQGNSNLNEVLTTHQNISFSKLVNVTGCLINSQIVGLLSNKEKIRNLAMTYNDPISLSEFKSLKELNIVMDVCFPRHSVLPLTLNNLIITSKCMSGNEPGFISNILALKNLRLLKLKMENLKDESLCALCPKDSPIEDLLIRGSKYLTNKITPLFTHMENLRSLVILECRMFKDCNEISLLEYERNFHLFSSKILDRNFDFGKAYSKLEEDFKMVLNEWNKSNDALFEELSSNLFSKLMNERKLIELNFHVSAFLITRSGIISAENQFLLALYFLLSAFDYCAIPPFLILSVLKSIHNFSCKINEEQRAKLQYCLSKALTSYAVYDWPDGIFICACLLLDLNCWEIFAKNFRNISSLLVITSSHRNNFLEKFMRKCIDENVNLLELFSFYEMNIVISHASTILEIRCTMLFDSFLRLVTSTYYFNIASPLIINNYLDSIQLILRMSNPFSKLVDDVKVEKMSERRIDPLDESIPIREKVAAIVGSSWATEDTFIACIDIDFDSNVELFKKIKSQIFKAHGFNWYLSIQNGEYLGEVTTSLHLESTQSEQDDSNLLLDYLKVKVAFINFNFDPSTFIIHTHKFQFKNDYVSDATYYEKDPFKKSQCVHKYRTVICVKLLKKEMKKVQQLNQPNNPLNYLSCKYPWLARQVAKNRPILHHTVSILTPIDILVDDCFSSDTIDAFGNSIIFYIKPNSRKSGLFAIDLTDEFIPTNLYSVKYLISNESFDPDSIQIGKYSRLKIEKEEENKPYRDSEKDYNLLEPRFYQPTVIEREPGKFFNKYVIQLVLVLGNTANGLDIGDPYDEMSDDDQDDL